MNSAAAEHASAASTTPGRLIPGAFSPRFNNVFGWYVERRLVPKRFHGAHVARESLAAADGLDAHPGPVVVLMNHPSWWDPITAALAARRLCPSRSACAPMEAEQLRKFGFFRRLGLFGIDPEDPASRDAMLRYVSERFATEARPTLWITPQGEFTDVRTPIRIRPGAAAVAAAHPGVRVLSIAVEYTFWSDAKPELLVRLAPCAAEAGSTTAWHRSMAAAMQGNQDRLAELAVARDAAAFEPMLGGLKRGGRGGRINPVYDLWLRARGKSGEVVPRQRRAQGAGL